MSKDKGKKEEKKKPQTTISEKRKIKQDKKESLDINEYIKIDLFTLEAKINFKNELIKLNDELLEESTKLKHYIKNRYTLNDLL